MIRRPLFVFAIVLAVLLSGGAVFAKDDRGLSVSPVRSDLRTAPGKIARGNIAVGNPSNEVITVNLAVKTFSVTNLTYDYTFGSGDASSWVSLDTSTVTIKPGETAKVNYTVAVPAKATPGGYYFAIFASTTVGGVGEPGTVQAASLVYTTVEGELVKTSVMQNATLPVFVSGGEIPYSFDVKDTGNVHFTAYFYGQTEALLFGKQTEAGVTHLLMPGAVRTVHGTIPSPLLPGVYRVEYGYKVDFANIVTSQTGYIIYFPPWAFILLLFVVLLGRWLWQRQQQKAKTT